MWGLLCGVLLLATAAIPLLFKKLRYNDAASCAN